MIGREPDRDKPWALAGDGLVLAVRVTPKGGRDAIDGLQLLADGRSVLKVRVRAAASEGAANAALTRLVAAALETAPRNVSLAAGATARIKRLKIMGDGAAFAATLDRMLAQTTDRLRP
jgi:uncharacterized protein